MSETSTTSGPGDAPWNGPGRGTNPRWSGTEPQPTAKPRKVRSGVKLPKAEDALSAWASQRWFRITEAAASPPALAEGLEYARLGQTKSLTLSPGRIAALVQGRMPWAYKVQINLPVFSAEQWERVTEEMSSQARYHAMLLGNALPPDIEDLFAPSGLRLFPVQVSDISTSCDCADGGAWCKHVCCVMALVAHRLASEPLVVFRLRGMDEGEVLEGLRNLRSTVERTQESGLLAPVYSPHLPQLADAAPTGLAGGVQAFWSMGQADREVDFPIGKPEVSHPLLRRLGPSPFEGAKFPLVGLLATCYEVMSEEAVRLGETADPAQDAAEDPSDPHAPDDAANA